MYGVAGLRHSGNRASLNGLAQKHKSMPPDTTSPSRQARRQEIPICSYELAPNPADHKVKDFEALSKTVH